MLMVKKYYYSISTTTQGNQLGCAMQRALYIISSKSSRVKMALNYEAYYIRQLAL